MSAPLLLLLSASAPLTAALRLPSLHRYADIKPALQHKRGTFPPSAALAVPALLTPLPALADDGWDKFWYEMNNEPPITLSPFEIHPVGYLIIVLYGSYLAWQVLGPPSEAEKQYAAKVEKEMAVAKAAAVPFLESAASVEGAKVMPSGVVYEELKLGDGDMPTDTEQSVTVHYTGTLADGTKFDSSLDRGEPTTFKVGQVIKGWQEGLSMMKVGGKARLTIPSTMAYGDIAMGKIPAGSALQFEVELLELKEAEKGLFSLPSFGV